MDNYKIKVNDEAESKEAQELFVQLGFEKTGFSCDEFPCYLATWGGGFSDYVLDSLSISRERKELTLPQLRDLVVLKRNDVSDANYRSKSVLDGFYFKSCDGFFYFMFEGKWVRSTTNTDEGLEPITKDPALISGADVLRALADGKEVEGFSEENEEWIPIVYFSVQEVVNGLYKFRLKPQTIKLELELPKPFEPKDGEKYWIISDDYENGYTSSTYPRVTIGAWKTEEEIKQVVEQLRKIRGTSS
ncbi:hypothetical protein WFD44_12670 [Acinetobacter baumannii]|uniref:hypothetical protein n=1 Tax=Acinetobacter baumannii TaxID=470 RepID=UPI0022AD198E|nr:hypothetical protein [Acinetobacter phage BUCTT20]HCW6159855.1 hypothetical protein [Acinetobacter baumannii]HEE6122045.1 hypothetical protein [Acinetobacter baumannii]